MDEYTKTWLQFVFPLYVWILVGLIITVSNYSSKITWLLGSNPVAVLATLFLLSYAKLLRTIIAALLFTFLDYPNGVHVAVWLHCGNIKYLHQTHCPLSCCFADTSDPLSSLHVSPHCGAVASSKIQSKALLLD